MRHCYPSWNNRTQGIYENGRNKKGYLRNFFLTRSSYLSEQLKSDSQVTVSSVAQTYHWLGHVFAGFLLFSTRRDESSLQRATHAENFPVIISKFSTLSCVPDGFLFLFSLRGQRLAATSILKTMQTFHTLDYKEARAHGVVLGLYEVTCVSSQRLPLEWTKRNGFSSLVWEIIPKLYLLEAHAQSHALETSGFTATEVSLFIFGVGGGGTVMQFFFLKFEL